MILLDSLNDQSREDLEFIHAVAVNYGGRRVTQFREFAEMPVTTTENTLTERVLSTFNRQLGAGDMTRAMPSWVISFMRHVMRSKMGRDSDGRWVEMLEEVRNWYAEPGDNFGRVPPPPPPPDPIPDPVDDTPQPAPPGLLTPFYAGVYDYHPNSVATPAVGNMVIVDQTSESPVRIEEIVRANRWQLELHARPFYGHMRLRLALSQNDIRPGEWVHRLVDESSISGAGGHHTVIDAGGYNYEPVAESAVSSGNLSGVVSHECLEVLANHMVALWFLLGRGSDGAMRFMWREICDPVQAQFYVASNGFQVSDAVLPAWFGDYSEQSSEYHFMSQYNVSPAGSWRAVTAQAQILPGGYMGVLNADTGGLEYAASTAGLGEVASANHTDSGPIGSLRGPGCTMRQSKILARAAGMIS